MDRLPKPFVVTDQVAPPTSHQESVQRAVSQPQGMLLVPRSKGHSASDKGFAPCKTTDYANNTAFQYFSTAAGFQLTLLPKELARFNDADIASIKQGTILDGPLGIKYRVDPINPNQIIGFRDQQLAPGLANDGNPYQYFKRYCELVRNNHDKIVSDFITKPDQEWRKAIAAASIPAHPTPGTPPSRDFPQKALEAHNKQLLKTALRKQFDIMREALHADTAEAQSGLQLETAGLDAKQLKKFHTAAKLLSTDEQVKRLAAEEKAALELQKLGLEAAQLDEFRVEAKKLRTDRQVERLAVKYRTKHRAKRR